MTDPKLEEAAREYALGDADLCHYVDFIAGARWAMETTVSRGSVSVFGTDACRNCEHGRVTLYSHGASCADCRALATTKGSDMDTKCSDEGTK